MHTVNPFSVLNRVWMVSYLYLMVMHTIGGLYSIGLISLYLIVFLCIGYHINISFMHLTS